MRKETDGGDSGSTGFEAAGGAGLGDAAEREDGNGSRGGADGAQEIEACAPRNEGLSGVLGGRVGDHLLEDGAKEDERRPESTDAGDIRDAVTGDAYDGLG